MTHLMELVLVLSARTSVRHGDLTRNQQIAVIRQSLSEHGYELCRVSRPRGQVEVLISKDGENFALSLDQTLSAVTAERPLAA